MAGWLDRFRPDMFVPSVVDIDLADLRANGFDALMLDLDNTLLPWRNKVVPDSSKEWVCCAKQMGMKLCIVSNTHNPKRLEAIANDLDIPAMSRALKPRPGGFLKAAVMVECHPSRTAVVGDQVLTDILGGNLAGMCTILVKPMHPHEFIGTKISRLIEKGILALLHRTKPGTKSVRRKSEEEDTK